MKQYTEDMELNILNCIFMKPELMEQLKIGEEHFINHKRLLKFMKAFYSKYQCFDIPLMYSVCKDKKEIYKYICLLIDNWCLTNNFEKYQDELIRIHTINEKEEYIKDKILELNNLLLVNKINTTQYKFKIVEIYKNADEVYKNVK